MSAIQEIPSDEATHLPLRETDLSFELYYPTIESFPSSRAHQKITDIYTERIPKNDLNVQKVAQLLGDMTVSTEMSLSTHEFTHLPGSFNSKNNDPQNLWNNNNNNNNNNSNNNNNNNKHKNSNNISTKKDWEVSKAGSLDIDRLLPFLPNDKMEFWNKTFIDLKEKTHLMNKFRLLFIEAVNRSEKDLVVPKFSRFLTQNGFEPEIFFLLISTDQLKWHYAWLLGVFYEYGIGTDVNQENAFESYLMTAETNDTFGQVSLGNCYYGGKGTERDAGKAFYWYQRTAENDSDRGQCNLGLCYSQGIGTEKNGAKAFYWYLKAAENGNIRAQATIGFYYENGIGTIKDINKAFYWYQKSAAGGWPIGQYNCAFCYLNGQGTHKDEHQAFELCLKAAEGGSMEAYYMLGYCFYKKIGTSYNLKKAFHWYKKAAEGGHTEGKHIIAEFYRYGWGTRKDVHKAFFWYREAIESGSQGSNSGLEELVQSLDTE
ncbi:hypothetical protein G9A89_002920 [Geosiphon pyriformis]|nr:hypothetical protein G9A89_002920 [Geosiphon pyriformis]